MIECARDLGAWLRACGTVELIVQVLFSFLWLIRVSVSRLVSAFLSQTKQQKEGPVFLGFTVVLCFLSMLCHA